MRSATSSLMAVRPVSQSTRGLVGVMRARAVSTGSSVRPLSSSIASCCESTAADSGESDVRPLSMIAPPPLLSSSAIRGDRTRRWFSSRSPCTPASSVACSSVSSVTEGPTISSARSTAQASHISTITMIDSRRCTTAFILRSLFATGVSPSNQLRGRPKGYRTAK